ncbi:MAG: hypothetical protein ACT4ON_00970 [Bacteroidota bacterium]
MNKILLYIIFFFSFCPLHGQENNSVISEKIKNEPVYIILKNGRSYLNKYDSVRIKKDYGTEVKILNTKIGKQENVFKIIVESQCIDTLPFNPEDFPNLILLHMGGNPFFPKEIIKLKKLQILSVGNGSWEKCVGRKQKAYFSFPLEELLQLKDLKELSIDGNAIEFVPERLLEHPSLRKIFVADNVCYPLGFLLNDKMKFYGSCPNYPEKANLLHLGRYPHDQFYIEDSLPVWYKGKEGVHRPKKSMLKKNGHFASYYLNKNKIVEGNFLNGKPEGDWTFWYADNRVCEKRFYKNGLEEGTWIFYGENGDTLKELNFEKGELISRLTTAYNVQPCAAHFIGESNCISKEFMNLPSGERTTKTSGKVYDKKGQAYATYYSIRYSKYDSLIKEESIGWMNGIKVLEEVNNPDSYHAYYYDDRSGAKKREEIIENRRTRTIEYQENGNMKYESIDLGEGRYIKREYNQLGQLYVEEQYKNGTLDGDSRTFFDDKLSSVVEYKNGRTTGKTQQYKNGKLIKEEMRSEYIRTEKNWDEDGKLVSEKTYKKGVLDGEAKTYYENGNIESITVYINGKKTKIKLYDKNGQLKNK